MKPSLGIFQNLNVQQKLSFQMIQGLKVLQVNTMQLEQILRAELEINPVLDIEEELNMETDTDTKADADSDRQDDDNDDMSSRNERDEYLEELKSGEDDINWEEYLEEGFDLGYSFNEETDPNTERYESATVYEETLEEYLMEQLPEKRIEERLQLLVQFLIGSLDDDGYLRIPLDDIAGSAGVLVHEAEEALHILWTFDPRGVGARDLRECMILQLRASGLGDSLAMEIVSGYWELFEKLRIPEICRRLNVEPGRVQEAIDVLKELNPKPGYSFGADRSTVIIPDMIVEKIDGKFVVMLNDRSIPSLSINKGYANMVKRGSTARREVKEYVRDKLNSATWFIRAIEQRRTTMFRVMTAIIERQKAFFEKGALNLVPLKQEDIAAMIEMNKSTVSRVTSNKYVQTPHGIFELKYFFPDAVRTFKPAAPESKEDADSPDLTADRIKNRIRQLIEDEAPKAPITDQKIADILEQEKLTAARRTVAKYREQMKILPARMRQKYD